MGGFQSSEKDMSEDLNEIRIELKTAPVPCDAREFMLNGKHFMMGTCVKAGVDVWVDRNTILALKPNAQVHGDQVPASVVLIVSEDLHKVQRLARAVHEYLNKHGNKKALEMVMAAFQESVYPAAAPASAASAAPASASDTRYDTCYVDRVT